MISAIFLTIIQQILWDTSTPSGMSVQASQVWQRVLLYCFLTAAYCMKDKQSGAPGKMTLSVTTMAPALIRFLYQRKCRSFKYEFSSWSMKMRSKGPTSLRKELASQMSQVSTVTFFTPECVNTFLATSATFLLIYRLIILLQGCSQHWLRTMAEQPQQVPISSTLFILFYVATFYMILRFSGPRFIIQLIRQYLSINQSVFRGLFLGQCSNIQLCSRSSTDYGLLADSFGSAEGALQNYLLQEKYSGPLQNRKCGLLTRSRRVRNNFLDLIITYINLQILIMIQTEADDQSTFH